MTAILLSRRTAIALATAVSFILLPSSFSATFPGNARVEINDPTGALTVTNNQFTVSCWFKISIPSDVSISQNMTILVNRKTGDETGSAYAYLLRYNVYNGKVEFVTRGSTIRTNQLITAPYLERWYHIAVKRENNQYTGFVDGRSVFTDNVDVGNSSTTDGVSIGGWSSGQYFYGDIQEVAIYQTALDDAVILDRMFKDQTNNTGIKGYYKLGYSANTADKFKNYVPSPPSGTDPGAPAGGTIVFEETDKEGEQSRFDSTKNGGEHAIAPLSGAFSWDRVLFSRPTPGVAFDFRMSYSSALTAGGSLIGRRCPTVDDFF